MKYPTCALIVEKSQTFAIYLGLLLQNMGMKWMHVSEMEVAKRVLQEGFVDVVIVGDQDNEKMNITVVQELANVASRELCPFIVISKSDEPDERRACLDAGCSAYLLKPLNPRLLHEALYAKVIPESKRRKHLRCRVNLTIAITQQGQPPQTHQILNLSKGGALISSDQSIPTGTNMNLLFHIDNQQVSIKGTVIYNLGPTKDHDPGAFGVLFHQSKLPYQDLIDRYLIKQLEQNRLKENIEYKMEENSSRPTLA